MDQGDGAWRDQGDADTRFFGSGLTAGRTSAEVAGVFAETDSVRDSEDDEEDATTLSDAGAGESAHRVASTSVDGDEAAFWGDRGDATRSPLKDPLGTGGSALRGEAGGPGVAGAVVAAGSAAGTSDVEISSSGDTGEREAQVGEERSTGDERPLDEEGRPSSARSTGVKPDCARMRWTTTRGSSVPEDVDVCRDRPDRLMLRARGALAAPEPTPSMDLVGDGDRGTTGDGGVGLVGALRGDERARRA